MIQGKNKDNQETNKQKGVLGNLKRYPNKIFNKWFSTQSQVNHQENKIKSQKKW